MDIRIRGACENNLKSVDVDIGDGLTVVTGVSGSGKTSLVFDTLYHEARRRFLDVFRSSGTRFRMPPADVRSINGIGPTIAVGQNLLNLNPNSTLASASGLHPFFRLLFARFGTRSCLTCGTDLQVLTEDEIVGTIRQNLKKGAVEVSSILIHQAKGSHKTLLELLVSEFDTKQVIVDGTLWNQRKLPPNKPHDISILIGRFDQDTDTSELREAVQTARALGANSVTIIDDMSSRTVSMSSICAQCGTWFGEVEPKHFGMKCIHCDGKRCEKCKDTGLHEKAASVKWKGMSFPELMSLSVAETNQLFADTDLPSTAKRLQTEITRRLDALMTVGLDYIQLNRSSPSLSRGESQRVRLAVSLTSRLEDIVHVLDEPTIGQHPADVERLMPSFRKLMGPVIFVEHDRVAAAQADRAIDIGPGAGQKGGEIVFTGTPDELWNAPTTTGQFFSLEKRVPTLEPRDPPEEFISIKKAVQHNLKAIDVEIPISRLTVITGRSGSGKSTLVEHVLVPSLEKDQPIGCKGIMGRKLSPVLVDQKPIGKNPRSNPGTYTKLSDIVRDLYASETGFSASHFSFNRPEGACPTCSGMGAVEVKMRYLPSIWITCSDCEGKRFKEEVLESQVKFGDLELSIADFYNLSITQVHSILSEDSRLSESKRKSAKSILDALVTVGLGYLKLGQSSPSLSGGEAQRVKLTKYLGKKSLKTKLLILDEISTGLHPRDLFGLLTVLDRLVKEGATIVVVEHNTDIIKSADWIVDLGPLGGPAGGEVLYSGPPSGLRDIAESYTAQALKNEEKVKPRKKPVKTNIMTDLIRIKKARANNLRNISVDIKKSKLTVVTGISGSGKSSLVRDVLQAEAERRFLESLSVYERQGTSEGPEAPVDSVSGLGVSVAISSRRRRGAGWWAVYETRSTVGSVTEISQQLNVLYAAIADRLCMKCGTQMVRSEKWSCQKCGLEQPLASPRLFSPAVYFAACGKCSGVGHINTPAVEKLIVAPDKPLCKGAMYSPGYYPGKYFCDPKSAAAGLLIALGEKHGFDPHSTPWNEMSDEARDVFLFGDSEKLAYSYLGTHRGKRTRVSGKGAWRGFYRLVSDWDVGQTFTTRITCELCNGTGLKQEYLSFKIKGFNVHEMKDKTVSELREVLEDVAVPESDAFYVSDNLQTALKRLRFLEQVGLGYIHLNRQAITLSAGESQRIVLSSLLGSGLTSLTILLDEPSRGMHPSEINSLVQALQELKKEGNTPIVVEHDLGVIMAADELIDMGPRAGTGGGRIVAIGSPTDVAKGDSITAKWLNGDRRIDISDNVRTPIAWMKIKGARGNNLKNLSIDIPLGVLVGFCGVSGSGKSTLLIDTLARALAPKKFTTSVAYEEIEPEDYDRISDSPDSVIVLDQGRRGIRSPGQALGVLKSLVDVYADSEDAVSLGMDKKRLSEPCSLCEGTGRLRTDLGFLPTVYTTCEVCSGSGRSPETWDVKMFGVSLPELNSLTLGEIYELFKYDERIEKKLRPALDVGLDYLVLRQPSWTLSGGEIQRLKIAQELTKKTQKGALFILDEPTVGQHLEDVKRLIEVLQRLVTAGNSVFVIEHHPHVLAACDWLIELGPRGGPKGGYVIAEGSPWEIRKMMTPTAPYIQEVLEGLL
ncbi:MAG: ATP-binding cassette domain-containing protein [Candidatus Thorarchaeota archaeon]